MFCKKDVLRNFTKFTGKYLCQSLFFSQTANLLKDTFSGEDVYVAVGNPALYLTLYLTGVHFRGELQHVGHGDEQKIKYSPIRTREIAGVRLQEEPYVTEHLWWLLLKKDVCGRRDINDGIFINEKEKKSSIAKKVVREIFLLYHLLLFVVTGCHSLPLVVPLVVTQFTTRLSFYKRSFLYCFIRLKI